jgi:hypothetical protein
MFESLQDMTASKENHERQASADQTDFERVESLSDHYERIKKKILASPELSKDRHIMAKLDSISSKFERVKKGKNPKRTETSDAESDDGRIEALQGKFDRIRRKISGTPLLSKNRKVAAIVKQLSTNIEKLTKDEMDMPDSVDNEDVEGMDEERTTKFSDSIVVGDEPVDLERMHEDNKEEMRAKENRGENVDFERRALADRFDHMQHKVRAMPGPGEDAKVSATLKHISAKFERLAGDEDEGGNSAVHDLDALADRFDRIKHKVEATPGMGNDAKVSAALKRISAKFERLASDEEVPKPAPLRKKEVPKLAPLRKTRHASGTLSLEPAVETDEV